MSTLRVTTLANADGTKTVPANTLCDGACRAWVLFNGTGTPAITSAFNVASITDNGTGDYTINFDTALSSADYAWVGSASRTGAALNAVVGITQDNVANAKTTTSLRVKTIYVGSGPAKVELDMERVCVAVFLGA